MIRKLAIFALVVAVVRCDESVPAATVDAVGVPVAVSAPAAPEGSLPCTAYCAQIYTSVESDACVQGCSIMSMIGAQLPRPSLVEEVAQCQQMCSAAFADAPQLALPCTDACAQQLFIGSTQDDHVDSALKWVFENTIR